MIRFVRKEDGALAIEFMMLLPMFLFVFMSSVESGILLARQVMLERGVDIAVRELRLNTGTNFTRAQIEDIICANAFFIGDCRKTVLLELRRVDDSSWGLLGRETTCVERGKDIDVPSDFFRPGQENEMMLIRACAIFNPLFPTTGLGLRIAKVDGAYRMVAKSVFVHEPNS